MLYPSQVYRLQMEVQAILHCMYINHEEPIDRDTSGAVQWVRDTQCPSSGSALERSHGSCRSAVKEAQTSGLCITPRINLCTVWAFDRNSAESKVSSTKNEEPSHSDSTLSFSRTGTPSARRRVQPWKGTVRRRTRGRRDWRRWTARWRRWREGPC